MSSPSSRSVEQPAGSRGLYATLLGTAWAQLSEPVRALHDEPTLTARGTLRIVRGPGRAGRMLAALLRMPRAHPSAATHLVVTRQGDDEIWSRTFNGQHLDSRQYATGDREFGERFGAFEFRFRLEVFQGSLQFRQTGVSMALGPVRIPVPSICAPRVTASEEAAGPRGVSVGVRLRMPLVGPVLAYDGIIHVIHHRDLTDPRA